jgi:hypothetical protein
MNIIYTKEEYQTENVFSIDDVNRAMIKFAKANKDKSYALNPIRFLLGRFEIAELKSWCAGHRTAEELVTKEMGLEIQEVDKDSYFEIQGPDLQE